MARPKGTGSLVAGIILCGLGLAGLGVGTWGVAQIVDDMDWVSVQANVVEHEGVPYEYEGVRSGGGTYTATGTRVKVWYEYEAAGSTYQSSRYSQLERWDDYTKSTESDARRRLALLEKGHVQAWYDPSDPGSAVLFRSERTAPFVVAGGALILFGIGISRFIVWRRMQREPKEDWDGI